jgi:putative transcriptional regulator
MASALHAVAETAAYLNDARRFLTEAEREEIVNMLATDPQHGDVLPGGAGIRKLRIGLEGRGKRSSEPRGAQCSCQIREGDGEKGSTMTKKAFEKIMAGLEDAKAHLAGDQTRAVVHVPDEIDVRAIRKRFKLTQAKFAAKFGFDPRALQDWEQKRRLPDRSARILLRVIEREPKAVERALAKA